jgi:transketolase
MRRGFVKALMELAAKDKNVLLVTGDLGFNAFEPFIQKFPDQYINCGIAEQHMVGMAAGLALSGKKPYVYSIVPFLTFRALEQIRADVCYQNLNVKIIGVGGGFSYGSLGCTHVVMEDLAVMRTLPNMTVLSPCDILETEAMVHVMYRNNHPSYLRLTNAGDYKVHASLPQIIFGMPNVFQKGGGLAVVVTGIQTSFCIEVAKELKEQGIEIILIGMPTLKPIDETALLKEIQHCKKVLTVEEHSIIGGLGSAVAEILTTYGWQGQLQRMGIYDAFPIQVGASDYLRTAYGLDKGNIKKAILELYNK